MPFRAFDAEEVQECLREAGGADKLRLTFFKEGDIGDDEVWDIWKLEGPAFAWYFHGSPHVHTWVNIARKASARLTVRRNEDRPSTREVDGRCRDRQSPDRASRRSRAAHAVAAVEAAVAGAATDGQGAAVVAGGGVALEVGELLLASFGAVFQRRDGRLDGDVPVVRPRGRPRRGRGRRWWRSGGR